MSEYEVLLGTTIYGNLVFAEISIGSNENKNRDYFSVSFDEVAPFIATQKLLKERAESSIDGYGDCDKYYLCEKYDCKPSELVDYYIDEGIENIIDISLYPESFNIEGIEDNIYFESVGCGQHDTRLELIPINKEFSEWLHNTWDKYHLEVLPVDVKSFAKRQMEAYIESVSDEVAWIENWLKELYTND